MMCNRIWAGGCLVALAPLFGGCAARSQSLGENTGGTAAFSTGGNGNAQDFGGSGAGGASGGNGVGGGGVGVTGGSGPGPDTGGTGPGSGGATPTSGGTGPTGGGATGGSATLSYPWAPTRPLDPSCHCASSAEICNAAKQCVPRCDDSGRCALWLTQGGVGDLLLEGSTLYYLDLKYEDPLLNPGGNVALWRVTYPDGTPEKVAGGLGNAHLILGRTGGRTYVLDMVVSPWRVFEASDDGQVRTMAAPADWMSVAVAPSGVFFAGNGVWRTTWEPDADPTLVSDQVNCVTNNGLAVGDKVWVTTDSGTADAGIYIIDPVSLAMTAVQGPFVQMVSGADLIAAQGNRVFGAAVYAMDENGEGLWIFRMDAREPQQLRLAGNWMYAIVHEINWDIFHLQRFPTRVGRLPQEVLPQELAIAAEIGPPLAPDRGYRYAVGDPGVFWAQQSDTPELNAPQYIFHAPLPPQPCDAELPCEHTGEVCGTSGLCEPAASP